MHSHTRTHTHALAQTHAHTRTHTHARTHTRRRCVDVNTGQRADVLIKADQPRGSYWITAGSQYRKGAPNAFATIKYM